MSPLIQPQLLRRMNVRRLLEHLQKSGPSTRADLTRRTGSSGPTVSKAIAALLESGLVEEGESHAVALGRPGTVLRLARNAAQVIGVVIDARQCQVVAAGLDGVNHDEAMETFATPRTYSLLIDQLAHAVNRLMRRSARTLSIGISAPGLINRREQKCTFSPNFHVTDGHSPTRDLFERVGVECVLYQETQALCLSERMFGGPESLDDFVVLETSTGLGLGVYSSGRLVEGHSGLAGELGHVTVVPDGRICGCGNRGCLETVATDSSFAQLISEQTGRAVDIKEAVQLIRSGQLESERQLRTTIESLAIAMAAAINIFNPAHLFVHGRLFDAQDGLFELTCELTRRRALAPSLADCHIRRSRFSKAQGATAAAIHALFTSFGPTFGD
ncbi:ROK family protein [Schlesneria sp. T3-172]|uniref:ROK family transcriptional regulator n=1 Tax=Schlesneria sphaerica TaxID=3373610 RepID=UPI0037C9B56C